VDDNVQATAVAVEAEYLKRVVWSAEWDMELVKAQLEERNQYMRIAADF